MDASFADDFDENSTVTLPSRYPKGTAPFFVMKYELTQGSYAAFLNTLSDQQVLARNPATEVAAARPGVQRYTVTTIAPFSAASEDRPMHHLAWMDAAAFADWAALRPLTELEFEKAGRGPMPPNSGEYAWGTDNIYEERYSLAKANTPGERVANPGSQTGNASYATTTGGAAWCWSCLQGPMAAGAFRSSGATREESGASYYGVLHLSGNLIERTVTIGNAAGRRFDGRHGDGGLNAAGRAAGPEVSRWPGSSNTGAASQIIGAVGTGFRGGSWASPARNLRISDREFAATPDNSRQPTFGYRFVRTASQR
jgi:formylglycine-generating enzyme required for sulfatase activity